MAAHPNALWILPALLYRRRGWRRAFRARCGRGHRRADATPLLLYAYLPLRSLYVARTDSIPPRRSPALTAASFGTTTIRHDARLRDRADRHAVSHARRISRRLQSRALRRCHLGVRHRRARPVRHARDVADLCRTRYGVAPRLADDARARTRLHGGAAFSVVYPERERRRPIPAARIVACGAAVRRADAAGRRCATRGLATRRCSPFSDGRCSRRS